MANESDIYNAPMRVEDAASMLRRRVQKNDRPYISSTTKLNNRMVDQWKKNVLLKTSDNQGRVPSGRVWQSWQLYLEGHEIKQFIELKKQGLLPEPPKEVIEFWKDFFENLSVEEMYAYGSGSISEGWGIIQRHLKMWFAEQKWERIFSAKPDDPLWWEKNYHAHTDYLSGKILPFWNEEKLKDIQQKVAAILMNQVKPQQAAQFK